MAVRALRKPKATKDLGDMITVQYDPDLEVSVLEGMEVHPAADLLPLLSDEALKELADDIAANGQKEPITTYRGQLLDGRNRLKACALAGVEPAFEEWEPTEGELPAVFVASRNVHRRHLTAQQKAFAAVRLEEHMLAERAREEEELRKQALFSHPDADLAPRKRKGRARDIAAEAFGVSTGLTNDAKNLKLADPALAVEVEAGRMTLQQAQEAHVERAYADGTLDESLLRPAVKDRFLRQIMEREAAAARKAAATKRKTTASGKGKKDPLKKQKLTSHQIGAKLRSLTRKGVSTSITQVSVNVTFGSSKVAQEYMRSMLQDPRVLNLEFELVDD